MCVKTFEQNQLRICKSELYIYIDSRSPHVSCFRVYKTRDDTGHVVIKNHPKNEGLLNIGVLAKS